MSHVSIETLRERLLSETKEIVVGARYAHYKHPDILYRVTGLSILESTEEVVVVYVQDIENGISFVRPSKSFTEKVETENGLVPRFKKVP